MKFIELNGVDLFLVVFIGFFFLRGVFKGFVYQAARIAAIIIGFVLAAAFSDQVGHWIGSAFQSVEQPWDLYLAYILILGATWAGLTFLAHLLKKRLEKEKLAFLDRLWGGVLGALKACLVIIGVVFALTALPGGGKLAAPFRDSRVVPGVYDLMQKMTFLFPESVMHKGREIFEMPEEIRPEGEPEEPPADTVQSATSDTSRIPTQDAEDREP